MHAFWQPDPAAQQFGEVPLGQLNPVGSAVGAAGHEYFTLQVQLKELLQYPAQIFAVHGWFPHQYGSTDGCPGIH